MGSRIGYCVKDSEGRSPIFRKQWISSIEEGVRQMWKILSNNQKELDGCQAIRDDLDKTRAFPALVVSFYTPPFDEIENATDCDISDNGLIVIDVTTWNRWEVSHIEIIDELDKPVTEGEKTLIARMDSSGFKWVISKEKREKLGEGLY